MCKINGNVMREARENAGMTRVMLAEKLGVTPCAISGYELGKFNPSDTKVEEISILLNIDSEDLKASEKVDYNFAMGSGKEKQKANNNLKRRGNKRYIEPSIANELLHNNKYQLTDSEVKVAVKNALKGKISVGGKDYIIVSPKAISIPKWQRNVDMANVMQLLKTFEDDKYDPIKLIYVDGKLYVVDGMHRLMALAEITEKGEGILCEILSSTVNAAKLFLEQSSGRKPMTVEDMYRAGIENEEEDFMKLKEIFQQKNHIQISVENEKETNPIATIRPSKTLIRFIRSDSELTDRILKLFKNLNWTGSTIADAYSIRNLKAIKKLIDNYGEAEVVKALKKNCKGAAYYEAKISPIKGIANLYDFLVSETELNVATE